MQIIGLTLLLGLAAGCSGRIADAPSGGAPSGTPGAGTSGGPGNTAGSGSCSAFNVGRTPARRLNSRELLNAASALLAIDARAVVKASDLPADISSRHGFDNDGTVARTFPQDADRIYDAVSKLVGEAFKAGPPAELDCRSAAAQATAIKPDAPPQGVTVTFHENDPIGSGYYGTQSNTGAMTINGTLEIKLPASLFASAVSQLTLTMRGEAYDGVWPNYALRVDGQDAGSGTVSSTSATAVTVAVSLAANAAHTVEITFANNQCCKTTNGVKQDVNLYVDAIALGAQASGGAGDPKTCREQRLRAFLLRAFRRPPSDAEVARYSKLVDSQSDAQQGMAFAVTAALMSPHFLFHIVDDSTAKPGESYKLDSYQLASRLSFFLWGSIPDQTLLDAAKRGELAGSPQTLAAQVRRMLADKRADEFRRSFPEQWLRYGDIALKHRDPQKFPQFSAELAAAMKTESTLLFSHVADNHAPLSTLLSADFTFVNRPLAELYGMSDAASLSTDTFTRHALDTTTRRGLLSHASVLTATTEGDYTHPILRGLWVLGTVMCKEPGQPPEGIPPLSDIDPALPIKQRLAQHRTDPSCAGCHDDIDPVGLGLENYDPIGRWRDHDGQHPVDAAGTLPGGFSFNGPTELAAYIAKSDDFRQCFAKHVAMFAVGRTVNGAESCQITAQLDDKSTIADVVIAIVTADAFGARTRE